MDIDGEEDNNGHPLKPEKGKAVSGAGAPADSKAMPWVEKYRPQSLADVAAHRDIVDTSNLLLLFDYVSRVSVCNFTVWVFLNPPSAAMTTCEELENPRLDLLYL